MKPILEIVVEATTGQRKSYHSMKRALEFALKIKGVFLQLQL